MTRDLAASIERDGFGGPVRVLDADECLRLAGYLALRDLPQPPTWEKARAVSERLLYDVAARPEILDPVAAVLGDDVVLWGISAVTREPGHAHPWHSDIESSDPEGGFVSVWIGIENTSRDASLQLVSGSHRYGESVQQARATRGIPRDDATADAIQAIALEHDPEAKLVVPDMTDGEAIFFDGRLWHGTDNRSDRTRLALLLQFASADRLVRIPDWSELDWPFRFQSELPPVIPVRGTGRGSANRLVAPPPIPSGKRNGIRSLAHTFHLPLDAEALDPWQPFPAFRGATPVCGDISCHSSVLAPGHSPHPPHAHEEEELLVVLHGEAELVIARDADDPEPRIERLAPGSFAYYPAHQHHTIRNTSDSRIAYLMLKWRASPTARNGVLPTTLVCPERDRADASAPFSTQPLLEGATSCLDRLHSHASEVAPGGGYDAHRDDYDVALVTLEGTFETLGRQVPPWSVVYYPAGEPHGLRNAARVPARYLVFELHRAGGLGQRLRRMLGRR